MPIAVKRVIAVRRVRKAAMPGKKTGGAGQYHAIRAWLKYFKHVPTIAQWERLLVEETLRRFYTRTEAADALGLTREGLRKKLIRMKLA